MVPETTKHWRLLNTKKRNEARKRYYRKHRETDENKRNSYERWTAQEKEAILETGRPCDVDLAKSLGRSVEAIQIKRTKLVNKKKPN